MSTLSDFFTSLSTTPASSRVSTRALSRAVTDRPTFTTPNNSAFNITAAASVLTSTKIKRMRNQSVSSSKEWQRQAWYYHSVTPELAYLTRFEAAAISRSLLLAARIPDEPHHKPQIIEDDTDPAVMAMSDFLGGRMNQSQELSRIDTHLNIVGISHIVAWDEGSRRHWTVLSNEELSWSGSHWRARIDGEERHLPVDSTVVIRIWNQDGRNRWEPTSPVRHLLPVLSELEALTKHVSATVDSRLAGAGLLILPQEVDFPITGEIPENEDPLLWELTKAMSTPMADRDIAASVVPFMLRVPGDLVDKVQHITFSTDLDKETVGLREEAIRRVALGLDAPPEILLGLADANHWPCDEETEVYTENGWVTHDGLHPGTRVLTLDVDTATSRFEAIDGARVEHVVDRRMISIEGSYHSSLTTPDHRWPVDHNGWIEWSTTEQLAANPSHRGPSTSRRSIILGAPHADLPSVPKFSDDFVRLLAWCATDADVTPESRGSRIRIRQRNAQNLASIEAALADVDHYRYWDEPAGVHTWILGAESTNELDAYGTHIGTRWVLSEATVRHLTHAQILLLLETAVAANGHGRNLFAVDRERLSAFEHAAVLAGFRVSIYQRSSQTGWGDEPVWCLSWGTRTRFAPNPAIHVADVSYTGVIFCPRVPVGRSFLARRNGKVFWTGNTSWGIEDSYIKLHIEPKLQLLCHAATVGYLQPYLKALGVPDWDRYICWYDVTQIKLRPNRSSDAKELHDDFLISDTARRQAAGFDDDDAPDESQLSDMILRKVVTGAPQLGLNLLPLFGINPVIYESGSDLVPGQRDPTGSTSGVTPPKVGVNNNPKSRAESPTPNTRPGEGLDQPDTRESNS